MCCYFNDVIKEISKDANYQIFVNWHLKLKLLRSNLSFTSLSLSSRKVDSVQEKLILKNTPTNSIRLQYQICQYHMPVRNY